MQTDPIGYMAGLNLYVYCENSPAMCIDPLGLDSTESECPSSSDKKWGLSLTWPAVNAYLPVLGPGIGFGHEFVWIPGEGGRSYFYVQGGWGWPGGGGINGGFGPVWNIRNHSDYTGPFNNGSFIPFVTPYGSFGGDFSWAPNDGPRAFHVFWGTTPGASANRQRYSFPPDIATPVRRFIDNANRAIPHNRQINEWADRADEGW